MDNIGMTLFEGDIINIDGIQQSLVEEELEKQEAKERELELKDALHNAFDDLSIGDESYEEYSSLYTQNQSQTPSREISHNDREEKHNSVAYEDCRVERDEQLPPVYTENTSVSGEHRTGLVWSDDSDLSGNFIAQNSIIKSPTHFHLDMNNVLSQSDESIATNKQQENYENLPEIQNQYENNHRQYYGRSEVISQTDYLSAETSSEQLQLLYEARGREIDRTSEELNQVKLTSSHDISSLKHELTVVKAEKETLLISRDQMQLLLSESEARIRSLSKDLQEKEAQVESLEVENKKVKLQISTAEGTVSSLERQVADLQSVDSIARSHQMHENFLKNLQSSHQDEIKELNRKLKISQGRLKESETQIKNLEGDLISIHQSKDIVLEERSKEVNQLKLSLQTAEQQIKILLNTRHKETSLSTEPRKDDELSAKLHLVESQLQEARKDLETYDMLLKLGLFKSLNSQAEDSVSQLNLCTALNFEDTNLVPSSKSNTHNSKESSVPDVNISEKMKQELLKCLFSNKKYREEVARLNEVIFEKQKKIRIVESELKCLKENSNQKKDKNISNDNLQSFLNIEENSSLKKEIAVLVQNFELVREKGEIMINALRDHIKTDGSLTHWKEKMQINLAIQQSIHVYTKVMENFGKIRVQTWEELREENMQLNSKRYLSLKSLENLVESLNELRNDLKLKDTSGGSELLTLKQVADTFSLNVKELKQEMVQYLNERTKLKNELWTIKLNLEKTKNENSSIKSKNKVFEEEIKKIEKEKLETIENCKESYLKFHEEAVSKMKDDLQKEYNVIITSLKEEVERVSNQLMDARNNYIEICHEKNSLEELCKKGGTQNKNSIDKKDILIKENIMRENETLKDSLYNFKKKLASEKEFNDKLESLLKAKEKETKNSLSIEENIELTEARTKVTYLTSEVNRLTSELENLIRKHTQEKELLQQELERNKVIENNLEKATKTKSPDITFSQVYDTVEKYKKLNQELKEEKEKLKEYYDNQIKDMNQQIELCINTTDTVVAQTRENCEKNFEAETNQLNDKILALSSSVNRLEEEKFNLIESHEEVVGKLTDELQNEEGNCIEVKQKLEFTTLEIIKKMQDWKLEQVKYETEQRNLKDQFAFLDEKYSKLKGKFFRLQNNFKKYRNWSEERVNYLVQESDRISREKTEDNEKQFDNFKQWLTKTRSMLTDGVEQVIENLKSIPERALPYSTLEPHINALLIILNSLAKLHIRDVHLPTVNKVL